MEDRILATCEANGLDYVTDKTNFQPDLTSRNAYRQQLTEVFSTYLLVCMSSDIW
jgi:tRNA(Ile)-lysidine synthase